MKTTRTTTWNRKQPRPGPRSGVEVVALVLDGTGRRSGSAGRRRVRGRVDGGRRVGARGHRETGVGSSVTSGNDTGADADPPDGPCPPYSAGRGSVARPSTTSTPGSARGSRRGRDDLPGARPAAEDDALPGHDPGVDPDRQVGRQPEHRHPAHLHPGQRGGVLGRGERRLARPEPVADDAVHVEAIRRERHAGGVARRVGLADDDDRVRRVLRSEPVGGAERGRVGQRRIAREQLVRRRRAARPPRRATPARLVVIVHRAKGTMRRLAAVELGTGPLPSVAMTDRPAAPPDAPPRPRHRCLPRPLRLAPGARADRLPRRGRVARGAARRSGPTRGPPRSTSCTSTRADARDGRRRRATTTCAGASSGRPASPAARPASPTPAAAILDEFRTRLAGGQMNVAAPAPVRLLHAAAAARCRSWASCSPR